MEETHYSTNEELQATIQELSDLQVRACSLIQESCVVEIGTSPIFRSLTT